MTPLTMSRPFNEKALTNDALTVGEIAQARALIAPTQSSAPTPPFPLFSLPLELRSMIYTSAIAAGTMSLLRACRTIHHEATPLVQKAGSYRIGTRMYGLEYSIPTPPGAIILPSFPIQNLEINVTIRRITGFEAYDSGVIDAFTDAAAVVVQ